MDNNESERILTTRDKLVRQGTSAIASLAGGAFLFIMTFGIRFRLLGIVLSLAALVIGLSGLFSKEKVDKKAGFIITMAGVLGLLVQFGIPVLRPIASMLLIIGALSLLASGIWKGIRFLVEWKRR